MTLAPEILLSWLPRISPRVVWSPRFSLPGNGAPKNVDCMEPGVVAHGILHKVP